MDKRIKEKIENWFIDQEIYDFAILENEIVFNGQYLDTRDIDPESILQIINQYLEHRRYVLDSQMD